MEKFLGLMAEVYEIPVEKININMKFREELDFDSMIGFSILCVLEEEYAVKISVPEFLKCQTFRDLYDLTK